MLPRPLLTILWGCAFLGLGPGCAEQPDNYARQIRRRAEERRGTMEAAAAYEQAKQDFAAGNLAAAENHIDRSLQADPGALNSLLLRVQIVMERSDDAEKVRAAVEAGLAAYPREARFHYYHALFLDRHGDRAGALAAYRQAAECDPDGVQYKIAAAEMMMEQGDYAGAENYLQAARARHPGAAGIPQTLGHLANIRQDYPAARRYFTEALALAPDAPGLREDLAAACFRLQDYPGALAQLGPLAERPNFAARADLQTMLAECHLAGGRPVEARKILKQLLSDPARENFGLWRKLMEAALLLNDRATLRTAAEKMIALEPQNEAGYLALARYWQAGRKPAEALAALERCPARPASELLRRYREKLRQEQNN